MNFYYDFHLHSCLSPCAENDMTPNNIAGMLKLAGVGIAALTDHNSAKNCPAFFTAARRYGITPVAGMELTTAEDIHAVCLFGTLEAALEFDAYISEHRMRVPNRTEIFGEQLILNGEDEPVGTEPFFLSAATEVPIDGLPALTAAYGGLCYPAHVDREGNGVIAVLGTFPPLPGVMNAEFRDPAAQGAYLARYPALREKRLLVSSDAHDLMSIRDASACLPLAGTPETEAEIRGALFRLLGSPPTESL